MNNYENIRHKILLTQSCDIKHRNPTVDDQFISLFLYIVSNGEKCGLMYNKNDWRRGYGDEYEFLIPCTQDYINILDTEYGTYISATQCGKCCLFSLSGEDIPVENPKSNWTYKLSINADQITDYVYGKISYEEKKCNRVLLLTYENAMQYYHLEKEYMSKPYLTIYCTDDDFLSCSSGNISYDEMFIPEKNDTLSFTRINLIESENPFPTISTNEILLHLCEYADGNVYRILTGRDFQNHPDESYLIFYSKKEGKFYKTEVFDKTEVYGISLNGTKFILSGFCGFRKEEKISISATEKIFTDSDVKAIENIKLI